MAGSFGYIPVPEMKANLVENALAIEKDKAESLKIHTHLKVCNMTGDREDAKLYRNFMRKKRFSSPQTSEKTLLPCHRHGRLTSVRIAIRKSCSKCEGQYDRSRESTK